MCEYLHIYMFLVFVWESVCIRFDPFRCDLLIFISLTPVSDDFSGNAVVTFAVAVALSGLKNVRKAQPIKYINNKNISSLQNTV